MWKTESLEKTLILGKTEGRRWQEYTEELYKKDLHDQDYHDGMITHLEPDILECEGQEARVRTGHGTTDWFQIGKGVRQGCILSACLFNLYAEYIMRNTGLEETQAGIKITGRSINNLRYADDTTLMAESEEELKSLLMNVKEESEKSGLKLSIIKPKIMIFHEIPSLHGK